jgi:mannose-6-phosphate isomerase-like protein (cupin superfamily)
MPFGGGELAMRDQEQGDEGPRFARSVDKPWGEQLVFAVTSTYCGAVDVVRQGQSLSLQFHQLRDETLYLYQGSLQVKFEDESGAMRCVDMSPGQSIRFRPLRKHRITALTDSVIFEVATPQLDDVVRLQDIYGRATDRSPTIDQ